MISDAPKQHAEKIKISRSFSDCGEILFLIVFSEDELGYTALKSSQ